MNAAGGASSSARPGPYGLGGWLWPVTWSVALLPLSLTSAIVAMLADDLFVILRHGEVPDPLVEPWALREICSVLSLAAVAWWWASRWFAQDPRLPRQGPVVLLACAIAIAVIGWFDQGRSLYFVMTSMLFSAATAWFFAARVSRRVRNTFGAHPPSDWPGTVFDGPREWSRRRWLLPGALAFAVLQLWFELPIFAQDAFETIPPPPPVVDTASGVGTAAGLIALSHPGRYIEASRVALALSAAGAVSIAGALIGLARGSRWTAPLALVGFLFAMAAPLRMSVRDWCCPFLDGPEFERMWREWCVVLALWSFGGAWRRRPERTPRAE